ncbi:hypothetical protein QE152_g10203 [Popillia japonica]|uniref:Uncharacterized protein n=1 Tax=Popillia japonica TaxID=7064 RepID=A0AAW1LSC0_POPJA
MGDRTYLVEEETDSLVWKRHLDQLIGMGDYYREGQETKEEDTENRMKKGGMEGTYSAEVLTEMSKREGENEEIIENRQSSRKRCNIVAIRVALVVSRDIIVDSRSTNSNQEEM